MATIDSPQIHQGAFHHELSTNDVTSHPLDERGGSATPTVLDEAAARKAARDAESDEGMERPPGLWLLTALGLYMVYRRFF